MGWEDERRGLVATKRGSPHFVADPRQSLREAGAAGAADLSG